MTAPQLLTISQVAERIGCSYFTARRLIRHNGIKVVQIPPVTAVRIYEADLAGLIRRHTFEATKARIS